MMSTPEFSMEDKTPAPSVPQEIDESEKFHFSSLPPMPEEDGEDVFKDVESDPDGIMKHLKD